ncbi:MULTISPECIES: hypothetical protein [unclassified Streptomyces]|uniref:DDE superfamily endonuclease n=1 Tax=Streptomyces sp. NBC_00060 TaxID=2975636 RepID=A0AAU2GSU0_9ACTN
MVAYRFPLRWANSKQALVILADPRLTGMTHEELQTLCTRLPPAQQAVTEERCYVLRDGRCVATADRNRALPSDRDEAVLVTIIYLRQVCPQKVLGGLLGVNPVTADHAIKATRRLLDEQKIADGDRKSCQGHAHVYADNSRPDRRAAARDHRSPRRCGAQMLGGQGISRRWRIRPGSVSGPPSKRWKRRHNTTHAKIRCLGERAMATIKGWRLLRKLRCSTNRITDVVKAVLVLHHASA